MRKKFFTLNRIIKMIISAVVAYPSLLILLALDDATSKVITEIACGPTSTPIACLFAKTMLFLGPFIITWGILESVWKGKLVNF